MKKCDHFKDLILTDYIDGELDKNSADGVERHLLDCAHCRAFLKEVQDNAALPLRQASQQPVPVELWGAISQRVYANLMNKPSLVADFTEQFKGWVVFPKVVPVLASLVLMFLAGSVAFNTIQVRQARDKEQGEYLVALLSSTGASSPSDNNEGASPIEHYFL